MTTTSETRAALTEAFIGPDMPRLWCPPLTHYTADGGIDVDRMTAHWQTMVAHVGGFLVPGSTGDGWELEEDEITRVLDIAIDLALDFDRRILVGALRPEVDAMQAVVGETLEKLRQRSGAADDAEIVDPSALLRRHHIAGFTVCAPTGSHLTQSEIQDALARILDMGLPTAIYQLPQVTGNEISLPVFSELALSYPNFLIFKDTSGRDRVPLADRGERGVFLVRGAEGDYARWLEEAGGCYQGLLLSTANCFAAELHRIIELLEAGEIAAARTRSQHLTGVVNAAFAAVADLEYGNAFANANKAVDHFMAHGPDAISVAPPLRHAGVRLPERVIREVGEILRAAGLMPQIGYLQAEA